MHARQRLGEGTFRFDDLFLKGREVHTDGHEWVCFVVKIPIHTASVGVALEISKPGFYKEG